MVDLDALHAALVALPAFSGLARDDVVPLETAGIAHDHFRLKGVEIDGRGVLLRVPRLSQWGLAPRDNLAYQTACFRRAQACGHAPRLFAVLPVSPALPMGALAVEEIAGAKPRLPDHLPLIARALAALHALPLPPPPARAPLRVHDDPVAATLDVIEEQAAYLDAAGLDPRARGQIDAELAWARAFARESAGRPHPMALVGTDTHPGNFLLEAGRAVFVDLEKALYGSPAIDLAHATLYTSTRWDPECDAVLEPEETIRFYRLYLEFAGRSAARALAPWLLPLRRLTWLRTLTWGARWRVLSARDRPRRAQDDWSAARLTPRLRDHTAAVLDDYFDPGTIARVRAEWLDGDALAAALEATDGGRA